MVGVQSDINPRAAASLIAWWRDAGVDSLVDDSPCSWLGRGAATERPVVAAEAVPETLPNTLAAFIDWLKNSPDVPSAGPEQRRIAPVGPKGAQLMVLVDMPEAKDHEAGVLMNNDVGVLFDRMLAVMGLSRATIFLAALCPGRPATGQLSEAHLPRLGLLARHLITLAAPKQIWIMGQATSSAVLGVDVAAARGKKQFINQDGGNVDSVASLHPRMLIQNPQRKAGTWADMQILIKGITG
jgi:uracil-DNA glycosylase